LTADEQRLVPKHMARRDHHGWIVLIAPEAMPGEKA
jgi:hypothetical protein